MRHLTDVPPRRGLIIFLNGTSSSGKPSIATELLRILDEPYFHMPADAFHAIRSRVPVPSDELDTVLHRTWRGYHRAVAGMAAAGDNVVMDHILSADWRLDDCLSLFVPQDVVLVGVRCPCAHRLPARQTRADGPPAPARRQLRQRRKPPGRALTRRTRRAAPPGAGA
ncbi:chloramphenicol phosphotransferase [Streptomyces sp. NPDC086077]|uniref:phosphotransferase-like protein n=1 Tax=Streptomyces sp. NPDC086077 TaxID=3154862 RepID=UPI00341B7800